MKKIINFLVVLILCFGFTSSAHALISVKDGGIESKVRTKLKNTKANQHINIVYVFAYKSKTNTTLEIFLKYPSEYLRPVVVSGINGEPHAACKLTDNNTVTCYNVQANVENNINVSFRILKDFDSSKRIESNIKASDNNVKFSRDRADITVEKIIGGDGNFADVEDVTVSKNDQVSVDFTLKDEFKNQKVSFESKNPNIFTVDADGIVTGISEGTGDLVLKIDNDQKIVKVIVTKELDKECIVDKIDVVKTMILKEKEVKSIDLKLNSTCATKNQLKYTSSNTNSIWVDANGYLIGLNGGKSTISISYNGKKLADIDVSVNIVKAKKSMLPMLFMLILLILIIVGVYYGYKKFLASRTIKTNYKNPTSESSEKTDETDDNDESYFDGIDLDV